MKRVVFALVAAFSVACLMSCASLKKSSEEEVVEGDNVIDESKFWALKEIDTARNIAGLSDLEKDVVFEINKARTNPEQYANLFIVPRLEKFEGNVYNGELETEEGASAVSNCISAMTSMAPLGKLSVRDALQQAAVSHARSQGEAGTTGHTGTDGSTLLSRINSFGGSAYRNIGENISYGEDNAREIVISLLIDDGVYSRGHRKNILNSSLEAIGCGVAPHAEYGTECVITFAGGYSEN